MTSSPPSFPRAAQNALSRRHFMGGMTTLGGLSWFGTSSSPQARSISSTHPAHYQPRFFNAEEYLFLTHACERLFPEDENGPGAQRLGVPRFIDMQMTTAYGRGDLWYLTGPFMEGPPELGYQLPYSPQDLYRRTITPINTYCLMTHNAIFAALSPAQQDSVLHKLEDNALRFNDIPGNVFFEQLRTNTLEGAFADPAYGGNHAMAGWKMIGFPGARADFMDWINQQGAPYPFGPVGMPDTPQDEEG